MISIGLIKWTVEELEDIDKMSDYVLRYSLALFMNLCLRKEGKKERERESNQSHFSTGKQHCVSLLPLPLQVLSDIIEHENTEVHAHTLRIVCTSPTHLINIRFARILMVYCTVYWSCLRYVKQLTIW